MCSKSRVGGLRLMIPHSFRGIRRDCRCSGGTFPPAPPSIVHTAAFQKGRASGASSCMPSHGVSQLLQMQRKLCGIRGSDRPPFFVHIAVPRGRVLGAPSCMLSHGVSQLWNVSNLAPKNHRNAHTLSSSPILHTERAKAPSSPRTMVA
jgi:hypothetical protein